MERRRVARKLEGRNNVHELKQKLISSTLFFTDLKAAFDKENRKKNVKIIRSKGIDSILVKLIEEIYKETKNRGQV